MDIYSIVFWASILLLLAAYVSLGIYAIRTADKLRRQIAQCDAETLKRLLEHYEAPKEALLGVIYSISDPKDHNHDD
jgi:hypothetical protein